MLIFLLLKLLRLFHYYYIYDLKLLRLFHYYCYDWNYWDYIIIIVRNIPAFKDGSNIVEDGASWSQSCGSDLEIWNLGSRNPKIRNLLIIDKYRALPPTVRTTLSSTAPKKSKFLPKPKTEKHSTPSENKNTCEL